jgi:kexin
MAAGYVDWNFMSVAHFGEDGVGEWTVVVKDTNVNEKIGQLTDWRLKIFGESIDAVKAGLLPMPNEHDDDDHDVVYSTTAPVSTAPVEAPTSKPLPDGSDHPTRPSIPKPTGAATTISATTPTSSTPASATEDANHDHFLPPIFPTFGVSKSTQIWIYGAMGIIIVFISSLLIYFYVQRRKRLAANPREGYEFEMLNEEDEELVGAGKRRRNRRAGELYDAFAGESDEEDLFSDDESEGRGRRSDEQLREK